MVACHHAIKHVVCDCLVGFAVVYARLPQGKLAVLK